MEYTAIQKKGTFDFSSNPSTTTVTKSDHKEVISGTGQDLLDIIV